MIKRLALGLILAICAHTAGMAQKIFYNLTADQVKVDSILPLFSASFPLGPHYADSIYSVELRYPEFRDMSHADIARLQAITTETWPEMPEVESRTVVDRKIGQMEVFFTPIVQRDGRYQKLVSFMLEVKAEAKTKKQGSSARKISGVSSDAIKDRYAAHSVLASGSWAKIRVSESGIYQLSESLIRKAGFNSLNKVRVFGYGGNSQPEKLTGEYLKQTDDLHEVPLCDVGGKRLFWAEGPVTWSNQTTLKRDRNSYSDYGYYFITQSEEEPLMVDSASFLSDHYPSVHDYHSLLEVDNFAFFEGGRNLFDKETISKGTSKTYTIANPTTSNNGSVRVVIAAGEESSAEVFLNGKSAGSQNITIASYAKGQNATFEIPTDSLKSSNEIRVAVTSGAVHLDYISIAYSEPKARPNLSAQSFNVPEYVHNITNQDLHGDSAYQMVIIIPTSQEWVSEAERLKDFHERHDSLRVRIVPADELYNEFSSGTPDANAYRRYMKMLYDKAKTENEMPLHLLLFSDCVWDNRMKTDYSANLRLNNFLLCHESEDSFSKTQSYVDECYFTYLDDNEGGNPTTSDKSDISVGRFPVRTLKEAKTVVDKTISYVENANAGAWQNTVMFMGDDGFDGEGNVHMEDIEKAAQLVESINPGLYTRRVMWDSFTRATSSTSLSYPAVTDIIKQQHQNGALLFDYGGHGGENAISHERVLTLTDFENFNNKNLSMWITASCDIMPFDGQRDNLGETAILNSKGGSVAFFGTTRTVMVTQNRPMNLEMLNALFTPVNGQYRTIGEAVRVTKNALITNVGKANGNTDMTVNKLQYALLGDPAIRLNIPASKAIIDSINGQAITSDTHIMLKANSIASIKGHIERNGQLASDFTGLGHITVRDAKEHIICQLNHSNSGAEEPFEFDDRTRVLYIGSDSIHNGIFQFTFAIPKDISYSNDTGYINIYAVNNKKDVSANGYTEKFFVGGTEKENNSEIGPSIYCYLNTPSFQNGDDVNTTPFFVANINDDDGLNTGGNAIGHDLLLIIDGKRSTTYTLNNYFNYDFGSYTSGTAAFSIPELSIGPHSLKFRAWDAYNNFSEVDLDFNVVRGLEPSDFTVNVTKNPASSTTTFIVSHDRQGCDLDITLEVLDTSGRLLWRHTESNASQSNTFTYDWDLTLGTGTSLQTGVYLYRARLTCDGVSKYSKAKKIIVIK